MPQSVSSYLDGLMRSTPPEIPDGEQSKTILDIDELKNRGPPPPRAGLSLREACQDPRARAAWDATQESLSELLGLRDEIEDETGFTLEFSLPTDVETIEAVGKKRHVDVLNYGVLNYKNDDYMDHENPSIEYAETGAYLHAAALGIISEADAEKLGKDKLMIDFMPFKQAVTRDGKRLRPGAELDRLCG